MFRPIKTPIAGFLAYSFLLLAASAQIGGTGWTPKTLNFKIQSPTNASQSLRYWFTNNIYHCLTFSNDGAFSVGNTIDDKPGPKYAIAAGEHTTG